MALNEIADHASIAAGLEREVIALRTVVRDLLESYLATFGGNKDELALRAEALLKD